MIKKTYIAPQLDVFNYESSSIIAASIIIGDEEFDAGQSFTNKHQGTDENMWNENSFSNSNQGFWDN